MLKKFWDNLKEGSEKSEQLKKDSLSFLKTAELAIDASSLGDDEKTEKKDLITNIENEIKNAKPKELTEEFVSWKIAAVVDDIASNSGIDFLKIIEEKNVVWSLKTIKWIDILIKELYKAKHEDFKKRKDEIIKGCKSMTNQVMKDDGRWTKWKLDFFMSEESKDVHNARKKAKNIKEALRLEVLNYNLELEEIQNSYSETFGESAIFPVEKINFNEVLTEQIEPQRGANLDGLQPVKLDGYDDFINKAMAELRASDSEIDNKVNAAKWEVDTMMDKYLVEAIEKDKKKVEKNTEDTKKLIKDINSNSSTLYPAPKGRADELLKVANDLKTGFEKYSAWLAGNDPKKQEIENQIINLSKNIFDLNKIKSGDMSDSPASAATDPTPAATPNSTDSWKTGEEFVDDVLALTSAFSIFKEKITKTEDKNSLLEEKNNLNDKITDKITEMDSSSKKLITRLEKIKEELSTLEVNIIIMDHWNDNITADLEEKKLLKKAEINDTEAQINVLQTSTAWLKGLISKMENLFKDEEAVNDGNSIPDLNKLISDTKILKALKKGNVNSTEELVEKSEAELLKIYWIWPNSVRIIVSALKIEKLSLDEKFTLDDL